MSATSPYRITLASENCFLYESCTVPPGVTLDAWRRAPRGGRQRRRRQVVAWLARRVP
jgi:hypothetical protein